MNKHETVASVNELPLGDLIHQARIAAGYSFKSLAQETGVAQGQISKLEHNQVAKPNPAHLAPLAEPLKVSIYQLYKAAGYKTPDSIAALSPELEHALAELPAHALAKVERYVGELIATTAPMDPMPSPDEFAEI